MTLTNLTWTGGDSRLGGGPHGPVVGRGADQLGLLVVLVDAVASLSGSVPVLLSQLPLPLNLLLTELSVVTVGSEPETGQNQRLVRLWTPEGLIRPDLFFFLLLAAGSSSSL